MNRVLLVIRRKWIVISTVFLGLLIVPPLLVLFMQVQTLSSSPADNFAVDETSENPCPGSTCAGGGQMIAALKVPHITRNQNDFSDYQTLFISAPSGERMKQIFAWNENDQARGYKRLGGGALSIPSAFQKNFSNDQTSFVSKNQRWDCDGEYFFDGDVHVENLGVQMTNACRVYTTGGLFISGRLEVGGGSSANLQLVSAKHILFGVDGKAAVSYSHVLAVSPVVRFLAPGTFEGVTISEDLQTPPIGFSAKFDDVFTRESIFPLLENADYFIFERERQVAEDRPRI